MSRMKRKQHKLISENRKELVQASSLFHTLLFAYQISMEESHNLLENDGLVTTSNQDKSQQACDNKSHVAQVSEYNGSLWENDS